MRVRLDHAGHERRARAIDELGAGALERRLPRLAHGADAVPFDQHLAGVRRGTRAVEDFHVGEKDPSHGRAPAENFSQFGSDCRARPSPVNSVS